MNLRKILELTEQDIDDLEYRKNRLERALLRTTLELESKRRARAEIEAEIKRKGDD